MKREITILNNYRYVSKQKGRKTTLSLSTFIILEFVFQYLLIPFITFGYRKLPGTGKENGNSTKKIQSKQFNGPSSIVI